MLHIRTILHPTDFSEGAAHAFRVACALARDYGARLITLHVWSPAPITYGLTVALADPGPPGKELMDELRALRAEAPEVQMEERLMIAMASAPGIVQAARDLGCDLIVMGTHGRTGLGRLLMGSTAEQVLRRAPCPVLTVRLPVPAEAAAPESGKAAEPVAT